jgi:uncharacterized C2H2 Zn-finger protein
MFYICSRWNILFEDDVLSQKFVSAYVNKNYVTIDNTSREKIKSLKKKSQLIVPSILATHEGFLSFIVTL